MPINLNIPRPNLAPLIVPIEIGEWMFLLGANGTGKSGLMHHFYTQNHAIARRISAHRQTWFSSSSPNMSSEQKKQTEQTIHTRDINVEARWKDDFSAQRASIAIYDLIDAENVRARRGQVRSLL
jgi:recombinational DNA repair ATPase RecF